MAADGITIIGDKLDRERGVLSPDGRFLAVAGESHTAVVLAVATKEPWATYYGHQAGVYRRVCGMVRTLLWLPDGSSIASGSTDGSIHIWYSRTGIHRRTLTQPQESCAVLALTLTNDGCLIALRGKDVKSWQL